MAPQAIMEVSIEVMEGKHAPTVTEFMDSAEAVERALNLVNMRVSCLKGSAPAPQQCQWHGLYFTAAGQSNDPRQFCQLYNNNRNPPGAS